jgi:hypothetical protein
MSFDRPILIYSDYCIHSKNYLQMLMKQPDIYNSFIRMNIDVDPQTKQRPSIFYKIQQQLNKKIVRVPTIIVKNSTSNEILLLSDKDAFKWLDFQNNSNKNTEDSIKGFNINEMGSFSDGYSKFNENGNESTHINDANEQSFKFYKNINGQKVLTGENFQVDGEIKGTDSFLDKNFKNTDKFDQSTYNHMENSRQTFQNSNSRPNVGKIQQLESMSMSQSKVSVADSEFNNRVNNYQQQQGQQRTPQIDFTSQNFGLSQELGGVKFNKSQKLEEFDSKLNQLMMDRSL